MATKTWAGGATGNWNVASNWSPSGVPATGDDVIINTSGCDVTLDVHIGGGQTNTGLNSLTITSGLLDTNDGSNRMLTVDEAVDIGTAGDLDLNGSDVSFGTLNVANGASASIIFSSATTTITLEPNSTHPTWGFSLGAAATVDFNGGTIKFAKVTSGTRYLQMGGQGVHVLNDVIIDTNHGIPWASHFEAASLDIQDGDLNSYGGSDSITITGDLTVGNGTDAASLTYTADSNGFHDQKFGSVTINPNGTLEASNQTTTITGETSGGFAWKNTGTYTHNNGKVIIDYDTGNFSHDTAVQENVWYDFEIKLNSASNFVLFKDNSGNVVTFLGDLTITKGKFDDHSNGDEYIIHGNTVIESDGAFGVATSWHTGNITHHGLVVLNGGTYYRSDAGGTVKMGGIRNIGGSIL